MKNNKKVDVLIDKFFVKDKKINVKCASDLLSRKFFFGIGSKIPANTIRIVIKYK